MRNLTFALFQHERIETTLTKAKEVRPFVDRILTLGKTGGLHSRRRAFSLMGNILGQEGGKKLDILSKVFGELAERFKDQAGGYTRIIRLGRRPGDAAPMAVLELIGAEIKKKKKDSSSTEDSKAAEPKPEKKAKASKKEKASKTKKVAA